MKRLDNKGSTLLLVIVSVSIIAILASALISLTTVAFQIKHIDKRSKEAFYMAESGLDQVYAGIGTYVQEALTTSYQKTIEDDMPIIILDNYYMDPIDLASLTLEEYVAKLGEVKSKLQNGELKLTKDDYIELEEKAKQKYNENYRQYLRDPIHSGAILFNGSTTAIADELSKYITKVDASSEDIKVTVNNIIDFIYNDPFVIQGLTVEYTDKRKIRSKITVDINIGQPAFAIPINKTETTKIDHELFDYILVSDKNIIVSDGVSSDVKGNIYSGGAGSVLEQHANSGIIVSKDAILDANSKKIITNSYIQVAGENGQIKILGNTEIYADSVVVQKTATNGKINVKTNDMYIRDDLELNGDNSTVKIEGNYYGYNYGTGSSQKHNNSSSIIINGKNAELDLTAVDKMILAGNSYFVLGTDEDDYYMTGESISVKGNQYPYLVPNQVDEEVQYNGLQSLFTDKFSEAKFNNRQTIDSYDFFKLNKEEKSKLFYEYSKGQDAYELTPLNEYFNPIPKILVKSEWLNKLKNGQAIDDLLTLGAIVLTSEEVDAEGNIQEKNRIYKETSLEPTIGDKVLGITERYKNYTTTLTSNMEDSIAPSLVSRYTKNNYASDYSKNDGEFVAFVSHNSDVTLTNTGISSNSSYLAFNATPRKGIIIADGNIDIKCSDFEGIIIAKGNITISSNTNLVYNRELVKNILYLDKGNGISTIKSYFDLIKLGEVTDVVITEQTGVSFENKNINLKYRDLITFSKWKKN